MKEPDRRPVHVMQDEGRVTVRFRYAATVTFKGMRGITRMESSKPVHPQNSAWIHFKSGPECDSPV